MKSLARLLSLWLPVTLWCGLLYFFSSIPDLSSGLEHDFALRKGAHMLEYGVLALLTWRAVRGSMQCSALAAAGIVFAFCVLYAMSDEIHQSFVKGRTASLLDLGVDSFGAFVALLFLLKKKRAPSG
ncbi:VanZ family protein [Candidatus Uhrbacteria bacterium]|nr:VanZ family protein [Candidatus Uhrbacteria bacterium]